MSDLARSTVLSLAGRPGTVAIALAACGLLWGLGPGTAGAARYTVAQCGWKVGHDAGWFESVNGRFASSSWCAVPEQSDPWDGTHVTSGTRPSTKSVAGGSFARWRWQAPKGTSIVTVQGDRWHVLKDGFRHRLGTARGEGRFDPFLEYTETDSVRRDFSRAFSPPVDAFESRLLCARPEDSNCKVTGTSLVGVRGLTLTLDDPTGPKTGVTGPFGETEWVRGEVGFSQSSSDEGSGVFRSTVDADGAAFSETSAECQVKSIAGQLRSRKMRPCPLTDSADHRLVTTTLSDGPHQISACTWDFAGNRTCADPVTLRSDNTAPAAPRRLEVVGGDGWRRINLFSLAWEVPDQGVAAPVTSSRVRVSGPGAPGEPTQSGPTGADGIVLPGPGEYAASVWLADAAGNLDPTRESGARLRFDDVPPTAWLEDPPESEPDRLRAQVSDAHSGVAAGVISIRRRGTEAWQELPTGFQPEAGLLAADFASENRLPGTWEVRARVVDRAGNETISDRRGNGSVMTIEAPSKSDTRLVARLHSERRSGTSLRVAASAGARLEGTLLGDRRNPLADQTVRIVESPLSGAGSPDAVRTTTTDRRGRFSVRLGRGGSLSVSAHFEGTARLSRSSAGPFDLRVPAGISFRAIPRRLGNGQAVRFSGAVTPGLAARLARGRLVAIQYLETASGRWRPTLVTRVRPGGRFRVGYRFRYVTGVARIRFRALLPRSPGFPWATSVSRPVVVRVTG